MVHSYSIRVAALCLLVGACVATEACASGGEPGTDGAGAQSDAVERYASGVAWLADDAREGRGLGTEGLADAGAWIAGRFEEVGLRPAGSDGHGFRHPFPTTVPDPANPHAEGTPVEAFNVAGRLEGTGPDRLPGVVVIGAHYDHLGRGGSGSLEPGSDAVHNGADDNASGTMALIEAARSLVSRRDRLRRDVVFVAFSAEERGLIGSSMFVHAPPGGLHTSDILAMLNIDMVGRLGDDALQVLGGGSAEEWPDIVALACEQRALECIISGDGFGSSDHSSFFAADIPVLHFFTGAHSEYHRPTDDADLVDAGGAVRIVQLIVSVTEELTRREAPLSLVRASEPPARQMLTGGARLGTIPDYAGPADGRAGLLLSAVRTDGPAERAGLRRGDLIVGIDDRQIDGIDDFMAVLSEATPDERATLRVERDGELMEFEVTYGGQR